MRLQTLSSLSVYLVSTKMRVGYSTSTSCFPGCSGSGPSLSACLLQDGYPAKVRDKRTNRHLEYHCELWVLHCSHGLQFPVVFQPQCHLPWAVRVAQSQVPVIMSVFTIHLQVYLPSTLMLSLRISLSAIKIAWIRLSDRNLTDSEIETLNDLKLNPTKALGLQDIASMSRVIHSGFLFRYGKQFMFIYSIYISSIYIHIRL